MRALLVLTLAGACAAPEVPPRATLTARIERRIVLPEGAALAPFDAARPGEAGPGALAIAHGSLYTVLQNLDRYAPAGPAFLAAYDPATLEQRALTPIVLGDDRCLNATSILPTEDGLLVACAGRVALPPATTTDGLLVELSPDGTVRRLAHVGRSPGGLARAGDDVWLGDGEGGGLSHVSFATFAVRAGAGGAGLVQACEAGSTKSGFVADVLAFDGRLFAACFNDDAVIELDPRDGTRVGPPLPTGAGPLRLARLGPSIHVLDDLGGTLTVIAPGPPPVSQRAALRLGRDDDEGGNDPQGIAGDATIAGITNSAYGTFVLVDLTGPLHVAASVDLKASPEAPTNFPTAVAYDGAAFFVAIPGLEASTRAVPSEIVRITWSRP